MRAKRVLIAGVAATLLGGMGERPTAVVAMPDACEVLKAIDTASLVAAPVTFRMVTRNRGDFGQMSLCMAADVEEMPVLSLMVRDATDAGFASTALEEREAALRGMAETLGETPDHDRLDLGEAGLWIPSLGQLTIWLHGGRSMLILSGAGVGDQANRLLLDGAAAKIIETYT